LLERVIGDSLLEEIRGAARNRWRVKSFLRIYLSRRGRGAIAAQERLDCGDLRAIRLSFALSISIVF